MTDAAPLFCGPLASALTAFIALMKTTGGSHVSLVSTLSRLDRYLSQQHPAATTLTQQIVLDWCGTFRHLRPASQRRYRCAMEKFCGFLRSRDPLTVSAGVVPPLRKSRHFLPCVLSASHIADLLARARALPPCARNPLRAESVYLVLVLLYTAGLRIGEAIRLDVGDFDAAAGTLLIRETKFAKTRLVPVSSSTQRAVSAYLSERQVRAIETHAQCSLIWSPQRRRLCLGTIELAISTLFRDAGLKPLTGRVGPRPHDLRHSSGRRIIPSSAGGRRNSLGDRARSGTSLPA